MNLPVRGALTCAILGALCYAGLAFGVFFPFDAPHFGNDIYNAYYYRLLAGGFDLPMRLLQYEGHYKADGTGLLYHGVAPLLTRVLLAPFVALNHFPTAAFSIWLWSVIGTGFYHLAAVQITSRFSAGAQGYAPLLWSVVMGAGLWFCSPGLFLSANISLYHEPVSITYAATAAFVFLMMRCIFFDLPFSRAVIPLAVLAGLVVHARPHIAVGLYAGVVLAAGLSLWSAPPRRPLPVVGAIMILLAFGAAFLQLNAARFGSPVEAHGQFDGEIAGDAVQYGTVYWGYETADSARARTFVEHGRFNVRRALPNLALYTFDLPGALIGAAGADRIMQMHEDATRAMAGYGRIEWPRVGMVLIWPLWFATLALGLVAGSPWRAGPAALPVVAAVSLAALLMLCYPTITLRYRAELWPLLITLCLLSLPGLQRRYATAGPTVRRAALWLATGALLVGAALSLSTAQRYANMFQYDSDHFFAPLNAEECAARVLAKGFGEDQIARICVDPDRLYPVPSGG